MPTIIDNIVLDENNVEFNRAADLAENSDRLLYLTGKAGTGKTTFLKYIRHITEKKIVVLAPTGVAALNAGGQTIHSFFKIPPSIFVPDDIRLRRYSVADDPDKRKIFDYFKYKGNHKKLIANMELLIIDEISMVRCDLLDVVDKILKAYRNNPLEPFGGVQVILIGDAFQLPPIAQTDQWEILKNYYETPFFFSSLALKETKPIYIELKKIYRQNEMDFINLLNNIRINNVSQQDMDLLNSRFLPSLTKNDNLNYITIATHNNMVDTTNQRKLEELSTVKKVYEAEISGNFPAMMFPTESTLTLKEEAQIMFVKNDSDKQFYNGKIAKIKKLEKAKITIETESGIEIEVKKITWENIQYSWNEKEKKINEEVIGSFTQFPVKLAWAITVHKSQGLTFDNVIADLHGAFSPGQVYVALSRCRTINGLILKSRISRHVIKTDPHVFQFAQNETHFG